MKNTRNFWIEIEIDGKKQHVNLGPVGKDGGFALSVNMRDDGESTGVMTMRGFRHSITKELILTAEATPAGETLIARHGPTPHDPKHGLRITTRRDRPVTK